MAVQSKHVTQQLDSLSQRETQIIDGFRASKERIIEQSGHITAGLLETIQKQTLALGTLAANNITDDIKALHNAERLALAEKTE